jgi:hypothetical protein
VPTACRNSATSAAATVTVIRWSKGFEPASRVDEYLASNVDLAWTNSRGRRNQQIGIEYCQQEAGPRSAPIWSESWSKLPQLFTGYRALGPTPSLPAVERSKGGVTDGVTG